MLRSYQELLLTNLQPCRVSPTYGDIRRAVCLQEAVEVVPNPWDPVDDLHQLHAARSAADLHLDQLPPQVAAEEAFHRLRVVGTQHPPDPRTHRYVQTLKKQKFRYVCSSLPEVVVKLEVGG